MSNIYVKPILAILIPLLLLITISITESIHVLSWLYLFWGVLCSIVFYGVGTIFTNIFVWSQNKTLIIGQITCLLVLIGVFLIIYFQVKMYFEVILFLLGNYAVTVIYLNRLLSVNKR